MIVTKNESAEILIMKRRKNVVFYILTILLFACAAFATANDSAKAGTTTAPTPIGPGNAHINWQKKFGEGYANAVTPPCIVDSNMYIGSGGYMYKLNKNTGMVLHKLKLDGVFGYTTIAPAYNGKGKLFVPISGGRIAALDISAGKMKNLWSSDSFGEQAISPILCSGDYIYTGAYGHSPEGEANNSFVAMDQNTGRFIKLASSKEGFYWTGALVEKDVVIFGSEEGILRGIKIPAAEDFNLGSEFNSETIDQMQLEGAIRSSVKKSGDSMYVTTKEGYIYKIEINPNGTFGEQTRRKLSGATTGVPIISGSKIFVGTGAGKIDVFDKDSLTISFSAKTPAYIQGEMLLSTQKSGTYIYGAYNNSTGGIYTGKVTASKMVDSGSLIIPDHKQYCISPVICDSAGNLYYKNDSGYIMAIKKGYFSGTPKLKAKAGKKKITLTWSKVKGAAGYTVYRATKKKGKYKKIKTLAGPAKVKFINKKLKKKKKYFYKVRPYKKIEGKTKYGTYSNISYKKVK